MFPWWYRWAALAVLVAAVWGHGWTTGAGHVQGKFNTFKTNVTVVGRAQVEVNKQVARQSVAISKQSEVRYEKGVSILSDMYGFGGMLYADTGCSTPAAVPEAAPGTDEKTPDIAPSPDSLAAITTLQLLYLQDWVEKQAALWASTQPGMSSDSPATPPP
jgi:hypothetical protein